MRRILLAAATALALVLSGSATSQAKSPPAPIVGASTVPVGSFALSGAAAVKFKLPADMAHVHTSTYPDGRTSSRYQQFLGGASVLGGQITVTRAPGGKSLTVVGAHFAFAPTNDVELTGSEARSAVEHTIGESGTWSTTLRVDPRTRRSFYEVRSNRLDTVPVRWVDAETGKISRSFDAVKEGDGIGVKGDHKSLDTSRLGKEYALISADGSERTYDAQNGKAGRSTILMTDANDLWNRLGAWVSPDQRAGVDAHYYAGVVERFYADVFNRDSFDDNGAPLVSVVHVDKNLCNAFTDGAALYFGDGFLPTTKPGAPKCLPLSGSLDVIAHEFTHIVSIYTSGFYSGPEAGGLNEGFSDIMGTAVEFYAAAHGLDPAAPADWRFGEDSVNPGSATAGFRNLADPGENGSIDHYSELSGTTEAHRAGTIAGHSFYLASVGGRNAGCAATPIRPATHTADCGVVVPGLGISRARDIYYEGFTGLQETANFCDARNAAVAVAGSDSAAISAAWQAVGVGPDCAPTPPPTPPCVDHPDATIPFESDHPYAANSECIWTYDNGSAGFAFHFSDLDVESDYDFIYVLDADGNALAGYTGDFGGDAPLTCIPTSTGSVVLVSDGSVEYQGFVVDAVVPCSP